MRTVAKPGDGRRRIMEGRESCPEQKKKELSTKEHEGRRRATLSVTALPHRQGCSPASRRAPPRGARAFGRRAPRERGRPARMHSRSVPLSFPAMPQPTPCRRERHGLGRCRVLAPLPVGPGGGDCRGCASTCAGGTPALPGGLHPLTLRYQGHDHRRSRLPVQQPIVLTILCIDVQLIVLRDGSAQSRRAGTSRPHPCPSDSSPSDSPSDSS